MKSFENILEGSCHCGNIQFRMGTNLPLNELPIRTCQCSFCTKQNGIYTSEPNGELRFKLEDSQKVQKYQFGHKTADFYICKVCGIVPLITCEIEGQMYGVINLCTTGERSLLQKNHDRKDFETESTKDRLSRRKKYWIGTVIEE